MVRVLHVVTGLGLGGTEHQVHLLATRATRERASVVSLAGDGPVGARLRSAGIAVRAVDVRRPSVGRSLLICTAAKGHDVAHGWLYHGCLAALALGRGTGIPVAWSIRQALALEHEKRATAALVRLAARMSRHAAAIVYNSARSAQQHEAAGFAAGGRAVIPNGFDVDAFRPVPGARERLRDRLHLPADTTIVGTVGRYHPMKDQAGFLLAARRVSEVRPDVRFAMFGTGVTLANRALAGLAADLGIGGLVHLGGEIDDVAEVLAGFDVLASSSRVEGMPNVVGEAMACTVPCVGTDAGDTGALLGDASRVVPTGSPAPLAAAILRVLSLDAPARRALGSADRDRVARLFSVAAMVRAYEDMHAALAGPRRCAA